MLFLLLLVELILLFLQARLVSQSLFHVFYLVTHSKTASIHILAILFFPGVVVHELSHYLTAHILGVRTGTIEFFPVLQGDTVKLGSVQIAQTDPIRRFVIGVAPVIIGLMVLLALLYYFISIGGILSEFWYVYIILLYFIFVVPNTMFSSKKDVEGSWPLLLLIGGSTAVLYFLGVTFPLEWFNTFLGTNSTLFIQLLTILLIPIGVNTVAIVGAKIITK